MKISELLREAEEKKKKSGLPSAPSINDEPEDELDSEDDDDGDEEIAGIEDFKKIASDMGKDLYSVRLDGSVQNATANHLSRISKDLPSLNKNAINGLVDDSEDGDTVSAIIVNARNGEALSFSAGESSNLMSTSGDDWFDLVDQDQATVLNKLQTAGDQYVRAIDSNSSEDRRVEAKEKIKNILNSMSQPAHAPAYRRAGFSNEQDYLDAEAKSKARGDRMRARRQAEKETLKKSQGAGRELR